jgi:Uma2 family endonuclease
MPESKRHARLCELLYQVLSRVAAGAHAVGADQFVYFDAANPQRCLAPDAFVKLGVADSLFSVWRAWEHGAPELCVEILSPSDTKEYLAFETKLERYRSLGTRELVIYDVEAAKGARLRVFDRIDDDLVERVIENEKTPSAVLGALGGTYEWLVAPIDDVGDALRLAHDGALVPSQADRIAELEREVARLRTTAR